MTKWILFALQILTLPALAWDDQSSKCILSLSTFSPDTQSTPLRLTRGDSGPLRVAYGPTYEKVYYLGTESHNNETRYIFLNSGSTSEVFYVPESNLLFLKSNAIADKKDLILNATDQKTESNCAAHAVAGCVISNHPDLPALIAQTNSFNVTNLREKLIRSATSFLYPGDPNVGFEERVQHFMTQQGLPSQSMEVANESSRGKFLDLLRNKIPVYLDYYGRAEDLYFKESVILQNGIDVSVGQSRKRLSVPTSLDTKERHAVLVVGFLDVPGNSRLIVLNSASGALEVWWWFKLEREKFNIIYPDLETKKFSPSMSKDALNEIEKSDPEIAIRLKSEPQLVQRYENVAAWFKNATPGTWFMFRRATNTLKYFTPLYRLAQFTSKSQSDTYGQVYAEARIRTGNRDEDRNLLQIDTSEVYSINLPPDSTASLQNIANLQREGAPGDSVKFEYFEDPFKAPIPVSGTLVSRSEDMWRLYDSKKDTILDFNPMVSVRNLSFQRTSKNRKLSDSRIRNGIISVMTKAFEDQSYQLPIRSELEELQKNKSKYRVGYSSGAENKFDVPNLSVGTQVAVLLREPYQFYKSRDTMRTVALGTITHISEKLVTIRFGGTFAASANTWVSHEPHMIQHLLTRTK